MPYLISDTQAALAVIGTHLRKTSTVTTDVGSGADQVAFGNIIFQNHKRVRTFIDMHPRAADAAIERLQKTTSIPLSAACEVYRAAKGLCALNPRGSWCVSPDETVAVTVAQGRFAGEPSHVYLEKAFESLVEKLPGVQSIEAHACHQTRADGYRKPRVCVSFLQSQDMELASIDTAGIPSLTRDGIRQTDHLYRAVNRARLAAWANQLGADPEDLPEILLTTALFSVTLGATHLRLR